MAKWHRLDPEDDDDNSNDKGLQAGFGDDDDEGRARVRQQCPRSIASSLLLPPTKSTAADDHDVEYE